MAAILAGALALASAPSGGVRGATAFDVRRPLTATVLMPGEPSTAALFDGRRLEVSYRAAPGLGRDGARTAFLAHAHRLFGTVFTSPLVAVACLRATSPAQDVGGYEEIPPAMEICMPRRHYVSQVWATVPPEHLPLLATEVRFRADVARR